MGDAGGGPLYQDDLRLVSVPGPVLGAGSAPGQPVVQPGTPTGVAFNGGTSFRITQGSIDAPAKFIFGTGNGVISFLAGGYQPFNVQALGSSVFVTCAV